jgi:hypothetical protein
VENFSPRKKEKEKLRSEKHLNRKNTKSEIGFNRRKIIFDGRRREARDRQKFKKRK